MGPVGRCIVYTRIRLLLLICLFISSFFFLYNFQTLKCFITLFSGTMRPRRLKLGTQVDSGQMYGIYRYQTAAAYSSLYFFSFLSLQFSNIKNFCCTFLRNCEAYKVETWYTRGQWVDVSCISQSGCCFLFVPYFFIFLSLQCSKIFITLFSGTVRPRKLKLNTLVDNGWMYRVYQNQAAASYLSLYFFIILSLQLSNINSFRHTFLRYFEA